MNWSWHKEYLNAECEQEQSALQLDLRFPRCTYQIETGQWWIYSRWQRNPLQVNIQTIQRRKGILLGVIRCMSESNSGCMNVSLWDILYAVYIEYILWNRIKHQVRKEYTPEATYSYASISMSTAVYRGSWMARVSLCTTEHGLKRIFALQVYFLSFYVRN